MREENKYTNEEIVADLLFIKRKIEYAGSMSFIGELLDQPIDKLDKLIQLFDGEPSNA